MIRTTAIALVLLASAAASAAQTGSGKKGSELGPITQPRPERIVPPAPPPMVPEQRGSARPEIRAGIDQLPVGEGRVRITVRAIAAEPGGAGKDPRLSAVESNLETLPLRYGSYKLVDERTFDLDMKSGGEMQLPGGRALLISPRDVGSDGRIRVHLEVLGAHPEHARKLHTDYSISRGGTLLVGGYRLDPSRPEAGVLLIAITQVVSR